MSLRERLTGIKSNGGSRTAAPGLTARMRRVPWEDVAEIFDVGEAAAELVKLRSLHPSETARAMQDLSDVRRDELVEAR